ncbi:heavy metal translocating P-type ATPase [Pseudorhodoferax sp. Leaf267]|jgi:Cd2+/Zn2+-exporting ATPase|uniref:heavy metal translocating P-type ATPase n=1 Tax=Pseudorhodoferax sp. Leaf267 TaxID=1736316 RepID=UPI0006F285E1|nr:heavy metal translocating P-type ATPase [Pseudorhodoferax sp. Leaf267]
MSAGHAHTEGDGHDHGAAHAHGAGGEPSLELVFSLACGVALLAGWAVERWGLAGPMVARACYVFAYVAGGWFTLREAFDNLKARRFEIDTLMLVAAVGAAAIGAWAEGALLLFLFSLGHALEHYAMGRARRAIEALAELAPERATVRRADTTEDVAVASLVAGDIVVVRPNERLPADGFVVVGQTSVDQASVTGESVPVDKEAVADAQAALAGFDKLAARHRVFAGTVNGSGAVDVMVARPAAESTMARMVKLVMASQQQRSPAQQFTEKFQRVFVPAVLVGVALLLCAGLVLDEPFTATFYRAMAVLVAASPCALAISVPSAVLSAVARAGRSGVLVKGGAPLQHLAKVTAMAFDKTGTLTEGKPRLTDAVPVSGVTDTELLALALAVEQSSDHPLAGAVVHGARERLGDQTVLPQVQGLRSITGMGVTGQVDGRPVHIGKPALFQQDGAPPPAELLQSNEALVAAGRTTMLVRHGERYLGVLGVMDTPRDSARGVVEALRAQGITRLLMLSGDNQRVAEAVAASVGLTEARGDLMPADKVQTIAALRAEGAVVVMVGDGVNDAPAMAQASVGIAMGGAGSDVALETADMALMADDLTQLPFAVALARRTDRVIRQNLWVSLGVVAVLIPSTIFGLPIGSAIVFHEGSTLLVVANALRLLRFRGPA